VHARLRSREDGRAEETVGDVMLIDDEGQVVVEALGLRLRRIARTDVVVVSLRGRGAAMRQTLMAATPEERGVLLDSFVSEQAAWVLRLNVSRFDASARRAPLTSFGMDSLLGIELRNRIEAALALSLPTMIVLQKSSCENLVSHLLERLASERLLAEVRERAGAPAADEEEVFIL